MENKIAQEEWRPVPGYEGLYDVSSAGRVRSYHNFGHKRKSDPVIMNPSVERYGYLQITLCKNAVHEQTAVHRIVAKVFVDGAAPGLQIDHINGIKTDNRAENLEWVTPKENTLRSVQTGAKPRGERHSNHKLTEDKVKEIRTLYKTGNYSQRELGKMYGVSHTVIGSVTRNETWGHVS